MGSLFARSARSRSMTVPAFNTDSGPDRPIPAWQALGLRSMTFGTFDLLHIGHLRLLSRIASWSEHLVVAVSADHLVTQGGKRAPVQGHEERAAAVRRLPMVSEVIVVHGPIDGDGRIKVVGRKIELVREHRIDCVAMGSDWRGEYEFLRPYCEVRYLERTAGISTSLLRSQAW